MNDKLTAILRLYASATIPGEKAVAKNRATILAERAGMTFDEALRQHQAPATSPGARPGSIFSGFDDWMEGQEPGYKARRAQEKAEKVEAWRQRRDAILARYGSREAALAPCWREQKILEAVAPWRTADPTATLMPGRWTHSLDGWRGDFPGPPMPPHVRDVIAAAYPMPTTYAEAVAEHEVWEARNSEMEDALSTDGDFLGDNALDLVASARAEMVRRLVERDMPVTALADLHDRFKRFLDAGYHDEDRLQGIFDDLGAMVAREAAARPAEPQPSTIRPVLNEAIKCALQAHPTRSDRNIARDLGCSPTSVGTVRKAMGLSDVERTIRRGGQRYTMRHKPAEPDKAASVRP